MQDWRVPFGTIDKKTLDGARELIGGALNRGQLTEGPLVEEFEKAFAEKFAWKHAVSCSSGTTAGEVIWSAIRELCDVNPSGPPFVDLDILYVITPACAFVATASCLIAAGASPRFIDIDNSLNLTSDIPSGALEQCDAIQFVATIGSLCNLDVIAKLAHSSFVRKDNGAFLVGDLCEAHGAKLWNKFPNQYLDAAIYSLYPAHLVCGVEGGVICTDNDQIADLCRSLKSHGRPADTNYFDFRRVGYNAKWSDLHAAVALASLKGFDDRYKTRRQIRQRLTDVLSKFEDKLILYRDDKNEEIAPHAFPIVLRNKRGDIAPLYKHLEASGIECKTLWGALPVDHPAFAFLGYQSGDFPIAERIGRTGLHFSCSEFMTEDDISYIGETIEKYFAHGPNLHTS